MSSSTASPSTSSTAQVPLSFLVKWFYDMRKIKTTSMGNFSVRRVLPSLNFEKLDESELANVSQDELEHAFKLYDYLQEGDEKFQKEISNIYLTSPCRHLHILHSMSNRGVYQHMYLQNPTYCEIIQALTSLSPCHFEGDVTFSSTPDGNILMRVE